jgi:hypothetical protein
MVKLVEITDNSEKDDPGFDVVDDMVFFMFNNSVFYRRYLFPIEEKIKKSKSMSEIKGKFKPMLDRAILLYIKKYNINKSPSDLLSKSDVVDIYNKIKNQGT